MPLDPTTNVGLTTTAPGAHSFQAFRATFDRPETKQENIFTVHIIPDDGDESFQPKDPVEPPHTEADSNEESPLPTLQPRPTLNDTLNKN